MGCLLRAAVLVIPVRDAQHPRLVAASSWAGRAPVQRALLAGDEETGISIHANGARARYRPVLL
jgi:hypothetical protein